MYNVTFESDNGIKYLFGVNGNTVFDMDLGNGVPVEIGTSQGYSQVGETVQTQKVSGRPIRVTGVVYGNIPERKKAMRRAFAPFIAGRLVFENEYTIRVYVKAPPSFSPVKNDGRFTMQLYAPYPYFTSLKSNSIELGTTKPLFTFPVNYATPHKFGEKTDVRYKNIYNDSDVSIPFSAYIAVNGSASNIVISNLKTFQMVKINGEFGLGDVIQIYRNEDNVLRAELTRGGEVEDIVFRIDETSDLFELSVGDNLISVTDDNGGAALSARITYSPVVVAVYET